MKTKVDLLNITEPDRSCGPTEEASTLLMVLRDAMYPTSALHRRDFSDMEELHELYHME